MLITLIATIVTALAGGGCLWHAHRTLRYAEELHDDAVIYYRQGVKTAEIALERLNAARAIVEDWARTES